MDGEGEKNVGDGRAEKTEGLSKVSFLAAGTRPPI